MQVYRYNIMELNSGVFDIGLCALTNEQLDQIL